MKLRTTISALGAAIWIVTANAASAGEFHPYPAPQASVPLSSDDPWQLISAPHLWFSGLEGDTTLRGLTADVDLGFGDLLDVTEFGFSTYLELRKEKFGFYLAPSYIKMSGDAQGPRVAAEFEQDFWLVHGGGFYNLVATGEERPLTIDLMAGLRYLNVSTDLDFAGLGPAGANLSLSGSTELLDPVIGFRAEKYLTDKLSARVRGDIGGFGLSDGNTSDLSWQAMALLAYDLNDKYTVLAGYRGLGMDASEGSGTSRKEFDLIMHGAILGVEIKW